MGRGPKAGDNSSSLWKAALSAVGLGTFAKSVYDLQKKFDALGDVIDFVKGKVKSGESTSTSPSTSKSTSGPSPSKGGPDPWKSDTHPEIPEGFEYQMEEVTSPISGEKYWDNVLKRKKGGGTSGPSKASAADDFIEGEFTPKASSAKGLAEIGKAVGPQVLEGEVVGGVGSLSTQGPAAAAAIEGELAAGAAAAGPALAGVAAVAIPLTVALAAVVAAAMAFKMGLEQAYHDIEALEGYSGDLSSSNSMAEVRKEMAEMRRAERLGPQLAELSDVTSRGQEALYDVVTELMSAFLDYAEELRPLAEGAIIVLKIVQQNIMVMKENTDVLVSVIANDWMNVPKEFAEALKANVKATKEIAKILDGQDDDEIGPDPFMADFIKSLQNLPGFPAPRRPAPPGPAPMGGP